MFQWFDDDCGPIMSVKRQSNDDNLDEVLYMTIVK